jgi:Sulfotransferase domain
MTRTRNIAMWSGPRNISTAMMYSFGNRPDCEVWDEPFYAFSLKHHGNDHPLRDEIIAAYESDYDRVVALCTSPPASGKRIFYQKHMTHHMLPGFDRRWVLQLSNAFLIRDPLAVLSSYARKWEEVSLRAIGIVEQWQLFNLVADALGRAPPVIDAEDVLGSPGDALPKLCAALGLDFSASMLSWPQGPKPFDGLWGRHWYNAVHASTGFEPPSEQPAVVLPAPLRKIADDATPIYRRLRSHRLATLAEMSLPPR